jgi:hypothetical protein
MAQEALIRAFTEPLDCLLLSDLPHILKVMRYRALLLGTLASFASPEGVLTFTNEVWRAMGFSRASVRDEAATKMDDGLAARFFSYSSHEKVFTALDAAGTALADACLRRRQSLEADGGADPPPIQLDADGTTAPPPSGVVSLEQAADVLETVLSAYWFHVLGACVHLGISGELASEERLRAAEYGLASVSCPC